MCVEYHGFKNYFIRRRGSERVFLYISWLLKLSFIVLIGWGIYRHDLMLIGKSIFGFVIAILPFLLEKRFGIVTPAFLDFLITLALLLHQRGVAFNLYDKFPYYDVVLHSFSSIVLSTLLILTFYLLERNSPNLKMSYGFIALLGIVFTMALGVVWEIGEFTIDQLFGYHTQPSLADTMEDLILDTISSTFVAILAYISMKRGSFENAVKETNESIKDLLKRRREKIS